MDRNKNPRSGRGQGIVVEVNGAYSTTSAAPIDELVAQRELFGLVVEADDRTTVCAPCPRCGTTTASIGPGDGPHYAALICLRGHHLRWLPRPWRRS